MKLGGSIAFWLKVGLVVAAVALVVYGWAKLKAAISAVFGWFGDWGKDIAARWNRTQDLAAQHTGEQGILPPSAADLANYQANDPAFYSWYTGTNPATGTVNDGQVTDDPTLGGSYLP